jgi:hypothetical protein
MAKRGLYSSSGFKGNFTLVGSDGHIFINEHG